MLANLSAEMAASRVEHDAEIAVFVFLELDEMVAAAECADLIVGVFE